VAVALSVGVGVAGLQAGATGPWTVLVGALAVGAAGFAGAAVAWVRRDKAGLSGRKLADMLRAC
jgi:hypothetical protein